ncbi:MAG TPA: hypothetical protein VHG53_02685 [Candidatus Limnocylindria bacterium]|nr:hypothetical protein [Candidatus Limnocylindria bacterium]
MQPPYPIDLVPLLPQFLLRRTAKADFPLRAMERLGLDRPSYFLVFGFGALDPAGERAADIGNRHYRTTNEPLQAQIAAGQAAGLVETRDGRWSLTERGRQVVAEHRRAIDAHFAALAPIDTSDLARLAGLLDQALRSAAVSPEPACRDHTPRGTRYRWQPPSSPLALLDAAIYGLWQVRDDCHVQAWQDAGLDGAALDVMTRVWHREAATADELAGKIPTQRPQDVRAALDRLRAAGSLTAGEPLALSGSGTALRERIEAATDRYFFSPWPTAVAAEARWATDRLAAVNAALA